MQTLKALKITSVLNGLYCFFCIMFVVCLTINHHYSNGIIQTIGVIATFGWLLNPTGVGSFIVCFALFLKERKNKETKQALGKKWIWIFIWPVITTLFYFIAMGFLVETTGGV